MKFELKDFQTTSARAILDELDEVRVQHAAARWKHFREHWDAYCTKGHERGVLPPIWRFFSRRS